MTGDRGSEFGDGSDATRDRSDELGRREDEAGNRNVDAGDRRDGFYVGYLDETPPGVARFVRRTALGLLLLAAALGAGLALLLERFDEGVFEYGTVRDWEGALLVDPVPRLVVAGGPAGGYLLVAEGKRGLPVGVPPALLESPAPGAAAPNAAAAVAGTLIQNAEAAMIETRSLRLSEPWAASREPMGTVRFEIDRDSPAAGTPPRTTSGEPATATSRLEVENGGPAAGEPPPAERNEERTSAPMPPRPAPPEHPPRAVVRIAPDTYGRYVGEIVDTKCYLGAMKPGRGKPHRACASLCIRGGVPAALLVRTRSGERALIHLMNALGQPVGREVLEFVGEAVEVTGLLRRADDRLELTVLPHRPAPVASATAGVSRHRPASGRRQGEAQAPADEADPLR